MQFVLVGFVQEMGCRLFAFERIGADRSRTGFTVSADLALSRSFGIRMQELPLLCLKLLERSEEGAEERALTLTEAEMRLYAATSAAMSKKGTRRLTPPTVQAGTA